MFVLNCDDTEALRELLSRESRALDYDAERRALQVLAPLALESVDRLVALQPMDPDWERRVRAGLDDLALARATMGSSYPPTSWSVVLSGFSRGESQAWQDFMELYRRPLAASLHRSLGSLAARMGLKGNELVDDFLGWLFALEGFRTIQRTSEDGTIYRFRGWLGHSIRIYRSELVRKQARPEEDVRRGVLGGRGASEVNDDEHVEAALDAELAKDAAWTALETMRRDHRSLWVVFLGLLDGRTLAEILELLEAAGERSATSISSIGRDAIRARDAFHGQLVRFRLPSACVTQEEVDQEYCELLPHLAAALVEYIDEHRDAL